MNPGRIIAVAGLLLAAIVSEGRDTSRTNQIVGLPLASAHVHNLFRATPNVYSGSSPETDAAFVEIAKLGVKTVISVDGGKPRVDMARQHGLRYIHLPIGYDGVPADRIAQLTRVAQTADGPIYVHCHHGLHRGPAAVAVICEAVAGWSTNQAVHWLKQAGTSPDYAGLYRSAVVFQPPSAAALARVGPLPELAATSSIVDAMVAIDEALDRLKSAQKTGWKNVPYQTDVLPAHTATILWEHFRELARLDDSAKRSEDFRSKMAAAEKSAANFRAALGNPNTGVVEKDAAFKALSQTCATCHKAHRN